jgi:hypothetical protein
MRKTIQNFSFAAIIATVLCAGTISARQVQADVKLLAACGGSCSVRVPCSTPNCACAIPPGSVVGRCISTVSAK